MRPGRNPKAHRQAPGPLIYGINPVSFALGQKLVVRVHVRVGATGRAFDVAHAALRMRIPVRETGLPELAQMLGTEAHQGIGAEVKPFSDLDLSELFAPKGEPSLLLALDGVEDPQNLGAIIRTAVAVGCGGIVLPLARTAGITPAVVKASAGLALVAKVARHNLADAFRRLKDEGYWIVGADAAAAANALAFEFPSRTVLVVGGEGSGLRELTRKSCDFVVKLPMSAGAESLNASAAAAVVLYLAAGHRLVERV